MSGFQREGYYTTIKKPPKFKTMEEAQSYINQLVEHIERFGKTFNKNLTKLERTVGGGAGGVLVVSGSQTTVVSPGSSGSDISNIRRGKFSAVEAGTFAPFIPAFSNLNFILSAWGKKDGNDVNLLINDADVTTAGFTVYPAVDCEVLYAALPLP